MYQIYVSPISGETCIILDKDGVRLAFPENPENIDYQAYLAWLAAGNEPEVIEA